MINTDQKSIFRKLSIKRKLVFIIMLTSGVTLLIASLAFVGIDLIHMRRSLTDELFSQSEILAYNSTAALVFNDKNTAETILSALKYRQSIVSACIYDKEGKVFAVYYRDQSTEKLIFTELGEDGYRFESRHLHLYHKIILDNEVLGTVYIRSDLSQIESTLKQYFLIGVFVLIIAAVVALMLSHKLQRVISVPVIQLAKTARMISREKNYSVRAEKLSEDELGDLVEAFNEMLIQIQARDMELRSERDYSTGIINGTPNIVCRIGPEGTITFVNPAAEKITGYTQEEHIGRNWWRMHFPGDEYKQVETLFQEIKKEDVLGYEMNLTIKGGHKRTILWSSINRYDESGELIEIIGVGNDITERKHAEEELEKHRDNLEDLVAERTEKLKATQTQLVQSEKMASLGMLVAGIAHEINTPMGAVNSMHNTSVRAMQKLRNNLKSICDAECLDNEKVVMTFKLIDEANRVIETGVERVTTIVRRLRSFARLDEAELLEADIHEGLEDTLILIHHEIKHDIEVNRNYGDIPLIWGYPAQLNQVFLNIFINAKQAIRGKGEITITTHHSVDKIHIEISDTGLGIHEEKLKKVFDPGFTTKGVGVGTGLGLAICYQIIQDHHGEIRVESEVDKGTTFTIILPTNLDEILNNT